MRRDGYEASVLYSNPLSYTRSDYLSKRVLCILAMPRCCSMPPPRQQLSLLASLPPGRVSGLIDLEGPAALAFGGGYGGFEGVGSGSERIARLSAAAHKEVELPGWCSLGHMLRRNWKVGREEPNCVPQTIAMVIKPFVASCLIS